MTYRIERRSIADGHRLEVEGLVDAATLEGIRAAIAAAGGGPLRVVLKEGCRVDLAVVEQLCGLERVELCAESLFLRRWLGTLPRRVPR